MKYAGDEHYDEMTPLGMTVGEAIVEAQAMERAGPGTAGLLYVYQYEHYLELYAAAGLGVPQRYYPPYGCGDCRNWE